MFGRGGDGRRHVSIAFISLGVWAHHMFAVGMSSMANTFFAASTMLVSVPTGIKIFNWTATMCGGKLRWNIDVVRLRVSLPIPGCRTDRHHAGVPPFDWQLTDSYFVVAHFHFTLIGGMLFGLFSGNLLLVSEAIGRMLNETIGKIHFWLLCFGFHLTFLPLHLLGFLGMPRRIYTYAPGRGWDDINLIASIGVIFQAIGILAFVWNMLRSARWGNPPATIPGMRGPWSGRPVRLRPNTISKRFPVVRSSRPLWDLKHPQDPDWKYE